MIYIHRPPTAYARDWRATVNVACAMCIQLLQSLAIFASLRYCYRHRPRPSPSPPLPSPPPPKQRFLFAMSLKTSNFMIHMGYKNSHFSLPFNSSLTTFDHSTDARKWLNKFSSHFDTFIQSSGDAALWEKYEYFCIWDVIGCRVHAIQFQAIKKKICNRAHSSRHSFTVTRRARIKRTNTHTHTHTCSPVQFFNLKSKPVSFDRFGGWLFVNKYVFMIIMNLPVQSQSYSPTNSKEFIFNFFYLFSVNFLNLFSRRNEFSSSKFHFWYSIEMDTKHL